MSAAEIFDQSFEYFNNNRDSLMSKHEGKVIAVYLDRVLGEYESKIQAYQNVPNEHNVEAGTFVIKDCSEIVERPVRVYNTNASFEKE